MIRTLTILLLAGFLAGTAGCASVHPCGCGGKKCRQMKKAECCPAEKAEDKAEKK
jgi:hypothetical protein